MALPFRPNCLPTALGPLPHRSARSSWDVLIRSIPTVLPLPLLSSSGEEPLRVAVQGFAGVTFVRDQVQFDHAVAARGYDELYLAYLEDHAATRAMSRGAFTEWTARELHIKRADAMTTTLMGPISAALRLVDDEGVSALTDLHAVDALAKHLCLRLEWQHMMVARSASTVVQWLYEPYLDVIGSPFSPWGWNNAGVLLEQAFGTQSGVRAVWTSATADIPTLLQQPVVEVVGVPLPQPATAEAWGAALHDFIGRQGVIGWGIVPQTPEGVANTRVGRLAARFTEFLQALEGVGLPVADVVACSLIMPEDTLGHLDANIAESVLTMTSQLSGMLRHSYGLD